MDTNPSNLLKLDPTPTFEEEVRDFGNPDAYSGAKPFDGEAAKTRIDSISRVLAISWTIFLAFIVVAQGLRTGLSITVQVTETKTNTLYLIPSFHLESSEFIAVVTTTTAAVFGFLVIVANHLFHRGKQG